MNEYIGKCSIMLLFCSENALNSEFVYDEWTAARALRKPIIPVFIHKEHIPALLSAEMGCKFDKNDFEKNVRVIYDLILKANVMKTAK